MIFYIKTFQIKLITALTGWAKNKSELELPVLKSQKPLAKFKNIFVIHLLYLSSNNEVVRLIQDEFLLVGVQFISKQINFRV